MRPPDPDVACVVAPASGEGQDRVAVVRTSEGAVFAVVDGAGGVSGGAKAAEHAVRMIADAAGDSVSLSAQLLVSLIARIDIALRGRGECALVVAAVRGARVVGASAGDCGAWIVTERIDDLTERQVRKPLIGTGSAVPVPFEAGLGTGTLVLASDGLFKYARRNQIASLARDADIRRSAEQLARLPRLRSGELQDDVAIVLCRGEATTEQR